MYAAPRKSLEAIETLEDAFPYAHRISATNSYGFAAITEIQFRPFIENRPAVLDAAPAGFLLGLNLPVESSGRDARTIDEPQCAKSRNAGPSRQPHFLAEKTT